jgi:hypothetical protein
MRWSYAGVHCQHIGCPQAPLPRPTSASTVRQLATTWASASVRRRVRSRSSRPGSSAAHTKQGRDTLSKGTCRMSMGWETHCRQSDLWLTMEHGATQPWAVGGATLGLLRFASPTEGASGAFGTTSVPDRPHNYSQHMSAVEDCPSPPMPQPPAALPPSCPARTCVVHHVAVEVVDFEHAHDSCAPGVRVAVLQPLVHRGHLRAGAGSRQRVVVRALLQLQMQGVGQ